MRITMLAGIAVSGATVLALPITAPVADGPAVAATTEEIIRTLRGKICTTRVGATFVFAAGGQFTYDGLWKSSGRYVIGEGIVTVTFDSGLERSFAISRHGDVFYMEQTPLRCGGGKPLQS